MHLRNGQAIVEFALILPIFVLLVFGAVEFGRAFLRKHLMTNAVREGARTASLPDATETQALAVIADRMTAVGLDPADFTTTIEIKDKNGATRASLAAAQPGDRVKVRIDHGFEVLVGDIIPGFKDTVSMSAVCTFRHE
jgi:Flp pilus assembly protein TadG